ncbi:MAG: Snf7 family protein [Candidatus Caldarchaeum sp.]|uniref:Snf7 family protein n=2 Tax=Caldiarchaeum subterraneum TaxID=311458 RepID=A0A7J3G3W5_CALS0|nr:Snf7 family protein [Candidatus Caldarchaeales archaeon]MDJ0272669.1 Snf7 family protein [Candidatus Caldarchaeales archaeon]
MKMPWTREPVQQPAYVRPVNYQDRMLEILTQLKIQNEKLNRTIERLKHRGKELFEQCVRAEQEKDTARATIYANEIAQLRKMTRTLLASHMSLDKVVLRLETVKEFGDVMHVLGPATQIIKQVQHEISGIVPEVAHSLRRVDEMLESIIIEAGNVTGGSVYVSPSDPEAQKIIEEAAEVAAQRMKSSFPELPETYQHLESAANRAD